MLGFDELTVARRSLEKFCLLHAPSLIKLKSGISFKLLPSDPALEPPEAARHLTTSATCYSSLADAPDHLGRDSEIQDGRSGFAEGALVRKEWLSEESAGIYCRCRALPMVIAASSGIDQRVERHIAAILAQLDKRPERFGIGEADADLPQEQWYPPNAFHTYWTLEVFEAVRQKDQACYDRLADDPKLDIKRRRKGMLLWARQQLGHQIGLHSPSPVSSILDSDQLAWSLAIFLRFDENLSVNLENRDFIKQALKCLFSTQTDGTWRHYKPLFHYTKAGNAYCYVFETFPALLKCALRQGAGAEMVRELLKPYGNNLIDLWRYADSTKMPLTLGAKEVGWCSGHRTNVTEQESWATASVFSYAQALRRLIGIWCREEAQNRLTAPRSPLSAEEAEAEMAERGRTWGIDKTPVHERLRTMFINPVRMQERDDRLEPDSKLIGEKQARSAILFGPPGTSKTTLIRLLADVIAWTYVEIHASHFVAEGLTQVQKTADTIFKQLSELDHAVVLFDEIDELVREREMEKDAFGRFLTTSMLPKLAELWEARKILYFVATNHINYFDSAIIRSNRFDALIFVSPPSFQAKIARLKELLSDEYQLPGINFQVDQSQIQTELNRVEADLKSVRNSEIPSGSNETEEIRVARWRERKLASDFALVKFVLLRYDELSELASKLSVGLKAEASGSKIVSLEVLKEALKQVADSEWRKNKSYADYLRDVESERRDYQMLNVWEVIQDPSLSVPGVINRNGRKWLRSVDDPKDLAIAGYRLIFNEPGSVTIVPSAPT
jgi:ATPase family associated with various cellular activities (AAA)